MNWKYVFNSNLKRWGSISEVAKVSKDCGYTYFEFKGIVFINVNDQISQTQWTIDDLIK